MYALRQKLEGFELGRLGPGTIEQRSIPLDAWGPGELEKTLQELWRPPQELPKDLQRDLDVEVQLRLWHELLQLLIEEGLGGKELAVIYLRLVETALAEPNYADTHQDQVEEWMELTMHHIRASRPANGPDVEAFEKIYTAWLLRLEDHSPITT